MTEAGDPNVVVLSGNHALIVSLPFHCALPLEFDRDLAPDAAAVLVDLTDPRHTEAVLDDLGPVDNQRIVVLADDAPVREVGVTLLRPVSVADIGQALERVAASFERSASRGPSASAGTSPEPDVVASGDTEAATTDDAADFRDALGVATRAARELADILRRYPVLARPDLVIGELAIDVADAAHLDMLGLWLLRGETYSSIGGHALRPTDERRQFATDHPLVARARNDGGVVVAHVGDDPRAMSRLPGAYEDSVLLSPLTTPGGNVVMTVGGGTDLDGHALVRVEEAVRASATVIDVAIAIGTLLASLEA